MSQNQPFFSLGHTDLYELSMLYAFMSDHVLSNTKIRLEGTVRSFRDGTRAVFTPTDIINIRTALDSMQHATFTPEEISHVRATCPFYPPWFFRYMSSIRLDPGKAKVWLEGTELRFETTLDICTEITLWEIAFLRIVCLCYYAERYTFKQRDYDHAYDYSYARAKRLAGIGMHFIGMTTRRPPSAEVELAAIEGHIDGGGDFCLGTSNIAGGTRYGVQLQGTVGHKYNMVTNGLFGITQGTRHYLDSWSRAFNGDNGTILTDTVTTPFFFRYFDGVQIHQADGIRQDSGNPFWYTNIAIDHLKRHGISPQTKRITYSAFADNDETIDTIVQLKNTFRRTFMQSVGMGQHFMPFPEGLRPLNIVMKATQAQLVNQAYGFPVVDLVKLSDSPGKAIGNPEVIASVQQELKTLGVTP